MRNDIGITLFRISEIINLKNFYKDINYDIVFQYINSKRFYFFTHKSKTFNNCK